MSGATTRCLEGGHADAAPRCARVGASMTRGQQPVDGGTVDGIEVISCVAPGHRIGRLCADLHLVAGGGEGQRDGARGAQPAGCGQQAHGHGMGQRRGIGQHRHDVIQRLHADSHIAQGGMMLHQATRRIGRIAHQHRFNARLLTPRQHAQRLQQPLELLGVALQPVHETWVGGADALQHAGQSGNRRQTVAHGMCQPAQQIVMYREPARDAGRLSSGNSARSQVSTRAGHR